MQLPRVGIIGAGGLSTRRIYPNIGVAGAQLAAVCDLDREKAEANAARWGGTVYTDWRAMVDGERLDGVIICVGPGAHPGLAVGVMQAGLPVYTEKPPAETSAGAREMAQVSRETGLLCMTAFKKRYAKCYRRAKAFIESGEIGDKRLIAIDYCSGEYANDGSSRHTFLDDFAIHCIDLVRFLFGDVALVQAASAGENAYAVSLQFADDSVGTLSLSDGRIWGVPAEEVEITGSEGSFMSIHNSSTYAVWSRGKIVETYEPPLYTSAGDSGIETGHLTELQAFVRALGGDASEVVSPVEQSYRSMVLLETIRRSAQSGAAITIEQDEEL